MLVVLGSVTISNKCVTGVLSRVYTLREILWGYPGRYTFTREVPEYPYVYSGGTRVSNTLGGMIPGYLLEHCLNSHG